MTTVYLIRHSKPLKVNNDFNKDSLQLRNEKEVLSVEGEEIAQKHFAHDEFRDLDFVFSSNRVYASLPCPKPTFLVSATEPGIQNACNASPRSSAIC